MKTVYVELPSAAIIQRFVSTLSRLDGDFEFVMESGTLDARSLMGIFSLDLSKPLLLKISNSSPQNLDAVQSFVSEHKEATRE